MTGTMQLGSALRVHVATNEVTTQEVQLAAGAQQHQCLAQLQQEFCQLSTKDASFDDEDLDDQALLEAARELAEQSSSTELCCSGLEALSVEADTCATDEAAQRRRHASRRHGGLFSAEMLHFSRTCTLQYAPAWRAPATRALLLAA